MPYRMEQQRLHEKQIFTGGQPLDKADKVLIMVHGRGALASDILPLATHLEVAGFALLAPQATHQTWYPASFLAPAELNEPWLSSALGLLDEMTREVHEHGIRWEHLFLLGFSQGACLTLEFAARHARRYGGIIAFTGGLIGDQVHREHYSGDFGKTPVFIGTSDPDPHVPVARVRESAAVLRDLHADVTLQVYPGMGHTISAPEIRLANKVVLGA